MTVAQLDRAHDFTGQTVAITGGAGVLGGEMACALAWLGANVAMLDRNVAHAPGPARAHGPAREPGRGHRNRRARSRQPRPRAGHDPRSGSAASTRSSTAPAAITPRPPTGANASFFDLPPEALRWVFDLNLIGTILPSQVFGRAMAKAGAGIILNVSSMNAFRPLTRIAAYSAAKAGVSNFTQWLAVHMAQEYSPRIRVNAIAPGFFLTDQNRFLLTDEKTGELTDRGPHDHRPHADGPVRDSRKTCWAPCCGCSRRHRRS